jgi:hypothetical protein
MWKMVRFKLFPMLFQSFLKFNNKWKHRKINNNVTSVGNKTVLGLFVEGTNSITYKMLSATMTLKFKFPII